MPRPDDSWVDRSTADQSGEQRRGSNQPSSQARTDPGTEPNSSHLRTTDGDEAGEFLISLDYQSDAERKRVEYLLNNQTGVEVEKLRGLTRIVRAEEDEFEAFYEDLSAKVDGLDHLRVNELAEVDITPKEAREEFTIRTTVSPDQVEWAFETIKRKRNATVEDSDTAGSTTYRQYVATTQSGTVRYSYELDTVDDDTVRVDINVWGYGEAPEVLRTFIEEELNYAI